MTVAEEDTVSVSPEGLPDYLYNAVHKETGRLRMYVWWESPTPPWQPLPALRTQLARA